MKKIISLSLALLVLFSFVGCASKKANDVVIPTTVEGRNQNNDFVLVTTAEQIYGKWETILVQEFSEADYGIPGGVVINAPYVFELPVEINGKNCGVYTLECDYTEFVEKMVGLYAEFGEEVSSDLVWATIVAAQPQYEYTTEAPYIMYASDYIELTDNPADYQGMYVKNDGSQLKITDGISFELVFNREK